MRTKAGGVYRVSMFRDLGLLVLRTSTGLTLMAHGYPKLFGGRPQDLPKPIARALGEAFPPTVEQGGPANLARTLESLNVPQPAAAAYGSGLTEFGGGIALILGAKTRLASLLIFVNMLVAIKKVHWQKGFFGPQGAEFPTALASSALTLFFTGPGCISLDALMGLFSGGGQHDEDEGELL